MTCRELYLTQADAPNLFTIVKRFYNIIGDLLDTGKKLTSDNSPSLMIYNHGKYFSEIDVMYLSIINTTKRDVMKLLEYYVDKYQ